MGRVEYQFFTFPLHNGRQCPISHIGRHYHHHHNLHRTKPFQSPSAPFREVELNIEVSWQRQPQRNSLVTRPKPKSPQAKAPAVGTAPSHQSPTTRPPAAQQISKNHQHTRSLADTRRHRLPLRIFRKRCCETVLAPTERLIPGANHEEGGSGQLVRHPLRQTAGRAPRGASRFEIESG